MRSFTLLTGGPPILSYAFYCFAGINFLLAVFVWLFIPETKQVSLEEIDTLFGGQNHVEKGGDLLHVEDTHHAHVGVDNTTEELEHAGLEHGTHLHELKD